MDFLFLWVERRVRLKLWGEKDGGERSVGLREATF